MMETIDIVDQQNRVVGRDLRTDVHLKNYFHRSIHVLITDNLKTKIFIQKRGNNCDSFPGYYGSSAAGHVDSGEPVEDAALRELEEEIGISGVGLDLLNIFDAGPKTGYEFVHLFTAPYEGEIIYNKKETEGGKWMEIEEIKKKLSKGKFTPNFKMCFRWFIENVLD